jgi:aspartate carbamoyltransferase regulatory subunit
MKQQDHTYKVSALENGTVIDHLHGGTALRALRALALPENTTVTVGVNLASDRLRRKDIIKIEGYELTGEEAAKVALISPDATLSIIRDYKVAEKHGLRPPARFRGLIRCVNPMCIVHREQVEGAFVVQGNDPVVVCCEYCERSINMDQFEFESRLG